MTREVFYTLTAVNRSKTVRIPQATYSRRCLAARDAEFLPPGWHGDIQRHSIPTTSQQTGSSGTKGKQ